MKKIFFVALAFVFAMPMQAQIVSSSSVKKNVTQIHKVKPKPTAPPKNELCLNFGLGFSDTDDPFGLGMEYKFDLGYRRNFAKYGEANTVYWEMDASLSMRNLGPGIGYHFDGDYYDESTGRYRTYKLEIDLDDYKGHNVQFSPRLGTNIALDPEFSIDFNAGLYAGVDYTYREEIGVYEYKGGYSSSHTDDVVRRGSGNWFIGSTVGVNLWFFKVFCMGFSWQRQFGELHTDYRYHSHYDFVGKEETKYYDLVNYNVGHFFYHMGFKFGLGVPKVSKIAL